jgi:transcriptional regulator with XRE-family HTH domain
MEMKRFDFSLLKTLRLKKGLTAEQLASRANVTRATIAKIESGFDNPTVQTLDALARVFQLTTSDLVRMAEGARFDHAKVQNCTGEGYSGKRIFFDNLEIYHLKAEKHARIVSDHSLHEDTSEICFVLSGQLNLMVADKSTLMEPGMAVKFSALQEHHMEITEAAEFFLIHQLMT